MPDTPCGTCDVCCSFPTKGDAALLIVVGFVTLVLSYVATGDCSFVEQKNAFGGSYGFGLYNRENIAGGFTDSKVSCVIYEDILVDQVFDSAFKAGRAFGVLGNIFTVIGFGMATSLACCLMNDMGRKIMGGVYMMASLCHVLIFIIFASELCNVSDCSIGLASGMNIGVILLTILAGAMSFRLPLDTESVRMKRPFSFRAPKPTQGVPAAAAMEEETPAAAAVTEEGTTAEATANNEKKAVDEEAGEK